MKTALVLSGGGAGGAFQVGVLNRIWPELRGEVGAIYGTSVGALNAAALKYVELARLNEIWCGIRGRSDVLTLNPLFYLGLAHGKYRTKKLKNIIDSVLANKAIHDFDVNVSVAEARTSDIFYVSERKFDRSFYADMVLASASVPFHMEPVHGFFDGGVRDHTPIMRAIEDGYEKITVICCNPVRRSERDRNFNPKWPYAINIGLRATDILQSEIMYGDFQPFFENRAPIEVYAPETRIIDTFEYDPQKIRAAMAQGYSTQPLRNGII